MKTKAGRKRVAPTLAMTRSAITNGSRIFDSQVDHRLGWSRRLRDLIQQHIADLGGEDNVSQAEQILIRRAAMLCLQCEMMESKWAANDGEASAKALDLYQRTAGNLRRLLESLGLQRRAKNVTPLAEYLEQRARRIESDDAGAH
jgi:hypothetical protein